MFTGILQPTHLVILLVVALLFLGPSAPSRRPRHPARRRDEDEDAKGMRFHSAERRLMGVVGAGARMPIRHEARPGAKHPRHGTYPMAGRRHPDQESQTGRHEHRRDITHQPSTGPWMRIASYQGEAAPLNARDLPVGFRWRVANLDELGEDHLKRRCRH